MLESGSICCSKTRNPNEEAAGQELALRNPSFSHLNLLWCPRHVLCGAGGTRWTRWDQVTTQMGLEWQKWDPLDPDWDPAWDPVTTQMWDPEDNG